MTPAEWMKRYAAWETTRQDLAERDGNGSGVSSNEWAWSDDEGVALTEAAHELIGRIQ